LALTSTAFAQQNGSFTDETIVVKEEEAAMAAVRVLEMEEKQKRLEAVATSLLKKKGFDKKGFDIDIDGDASRYKAEIMQVTNARMPGLRSMYNKYLKLKPGFSGKVTIKFTIVPDGDIVNIFIVSSTTGYSEFDDAVKNMVATWKWKAIKSGNTTSTILFDFTE
jgi:TonB family protein